MKFFKTHSDHELKRIKKTVKQILELQPEYAQLSDEQLKSKTEEFKAWLSQRLDEGIPVIIEYELATEEIIPYTPEQQKVIDTALHTYKNITNISVDNELATLDITYKKDIETMFNNQAKEYNERLSNIENLLNTTETSALLLDNLENDLEKEV